MKKEYETFTEITRELLNGIKCGDLVKCNDWKKPLRVMGVTENYFVMARGAFGKILYSVCEKKPAPYKFNGFSKGAFRIGRDNLIFGSIDGYKWETEEDANAYLAEFESGAYALSERAAVDLNRISIKRKEG